MQYFSNWVSRSGVRGSERRKWVLAEEFYWWSEICNTSVNEISVLIVAFLSVILLKKKALSSKYGVTVLIS